MLATSDARDLSEKTLRYPGHRNMIEVLQGAGRLASETVNVGGTPVRPIDLTSAVLFKAWQFEDGERDFTVMRLVVEGVINGQKETRQLDLLDRYDATNQVSSMARTTGYTCSATAHVVADGTFRDVGVSSLEHLGRDSSCYHRMLEYLGASGIAFLERSL